MHAITPDMMLLTRYGAMRSVAVDISRARLSLPPAWRPVLAASLRMVMGLGVGVALGAACGNAGFWAAIGLCLGAALQAVARCT